MATVEFAEVSLLFINKLSPSEKADFGDDREADMSGATEFSDAADHDIIWGELTTEGNTLRAAILAAANGNKMQKDALPPAVKKWDRKARKWGKYVSEKAQENEDIDDQINVINVSGFDYNSVTRESKGAAGQVTGFQMKPIVGVPAKTAIKSDALEPNCTYVTIFHKDLTMLDAISWVDDQIILPPSTDPFVVHATTDSRESEVTLSSGVKWYGTRYALNKTGRGPTSEKSSATPQ